MQYLMFYKFNMSTIFTFYYHFFTLKIYQQFSKKIFDENEKFEFHFCESVICQYGI